MIFQLCKWHFDINWYKFEKGGPADVFQIYLNGIHFNPLQFCPSMFRLGFPVFCLRSSIVLSRFCDISVNSMTIWSVLKLPKIAWPSPFKPTTLRSAKGETANDAGRQVKKVNSTEISAVHHQCLATSELQKTLERLSPTVSFKPRVILPASEPAVLRGMFSGIRFTYLGPQERIEPEVKQWSE